MSCTALSRAIIFVQRHERSELAEQIYLSADNWPSGVAGCNPVCAGVQGAAALRPTCPAERQT